MSEPPRSSPAPWALGWGCLHMFPVCSGLPQGPYGQQGNTCPWPVPGFLCRRHRFMLISFMITEKIPDSCHQVLAVPLMSLVYPERVSNPTLHTYARLSPAMKGSKNVTAVEMPVRTKEQKLLMLEVGGCTCLQRVDSRGQGREEVRGLRGSSGLGMWESAWRVRPWVCWLLGLGLLRVLLQGT